MLTISTIPEALAELEKHTGRAWTDSELFDVATTRGIKLHAAPPITAQTTIQEFVIGESLKEKFRSPPGHAILAVLFPWQVQQLWIIGETATNHPSDYTYKAEGEYHLFTEPVRVTREQVRISSESLNKILDAWSKAQAGVWIADTAQPGGMRCQHGPDWMFPTDTPAAKEDRGDMIAIQSLYYATKYTGDRPWLKHDTWGAELACKLIVFNYPVNLQGSGWDGLKNWHIDKWGRKAPIVLNGYFERVFNMAKSSVNGAKIREHDTPANWIEWAKDKGYDVAHLMPAETKVEAVPDAKKSNDRPLSQQLFQEQEILRVIRSLSYDPKNLPKREKGASGIKAAVRQELTFSYKVFDKAWGRLRANQDIQGAE